MKRRFQAGLALIFLAAAGAGAAIAWAPFQTHMALRRLALWRGGAHRVTAGPLLAYELSSCRAGEPCRCVALIHGMGDSAMTWDKIMLGRDGAASPPRGTRILAVDMPGTDGSPPASDYGLRAQARVLRSALETRCPQWTVAGNSLGGWISAWLAVDWPQGVKRLVLINAAGLSDPSGLTREAAQVLAAPTVPALKAFNARAYGRPRLIPERVWPAAVASIRARPTLAIFAAFKTTDILDAHLKDIRADTYVLWGSADEVLSIGFAERFRRGVRGARLEMIPGCGHLPQQECPVSVSGALFSAEL